MNIKFQIFGRKIKFYIFYFIGKLVTDWHRKTAKPVLKVIVRTVLSGNFYYYIE